MTLRTWREVAVPHEDVLTGPLEVRGHQSSDLRPACLRLTSKVRDRSRSSKDLLSQTERAATVEWPLEIHVDESAYFGQVVPKLRGILDSVAKEKPDADAVINGKQPGNPRADFRKVALGDIYGDPSLTVDPNKKSTSRENQVGIVVKKSEAGDSLRVSTYVLDKEAFDAALDWIRPVEHRSQALPSLHVTWLDGDGRTVIEDEVRISKTEARYFSFYYGAIQGAFQSFVPDVGLRLGPFIYAHTPAGVEYFTALKIPYRREVPLSELKRIAQVKCALVARDGGRPK